MRIWQKNEAYGQLVIWGFSKFIAYGVPLIVIIRKSNFEVHSWFTKVIFFNIIKKTKIYQKTLFGFYKIYRCYLRTNIKTLILYIFSMFAFVSFGILFWFKYYIKTNISRTKPLFAIFVLLRLTKLTLRKEYMLNVVNIEVKAELVQLASSPSLLSQTKAQFGLRLCIVRTLMLLFI